jgi:hypothetical protein
MPSAYTQAGTSVEKHTIAVRNVAEPKGIHNPRAVDEWKAKASLTGNKSYHIAKIDGEARKLPDPPDNTAGSAPTVAPGLAQDSGEFSQK